MQPATSSATATTILQTTATVTEVTVITHQEHLILHILEPNQITLTYNEPQTALLLTFKIPATPPLINSGIEIGDTPSNLNSSVDKKGNVADDIPNIQNTSTTTNIS